MPSQLAVQMYTIRDFTKTPSELAESLVKIAQIGYKAVQLSAVAAVEGDAPAVSASQARQMLDDTGLTCAATHRNWDNLMQRTDDEIAFHNTLGCAYTAIGGLPGRYGPWATQGIDEYRRFLDDATPVIEKLKAAGIKFAFHHHDHEFARAGEGSKTLFDVLLAESSPDLMLEIDTYWLVHAGLNPPRMLERLPGRVPVVHLKDKEVVLRQGPTFAPVGEGNLNWDEILPACAKIGTECYCVEQDVCRRDPFDCLRSSYQFLVGKGLA